MNVGIFKRFYGFLFIFKTYYTGQHELLLMLLLGIKINVRACSEYNTKFTGYFSALPYTIS